MPQTDLEEMVGRVARLERYLDEETDVHTEKKLYAVLLIYTKLAGEAQEVVEGPLNDMAVAVEVGRDHPGAGRCIRHAVPGPAQTRCAAPASCWTRFARRVATTSRPPSYGHSGVEPSGGNRHANLSAAVLFGGARLDHPGAGGWASSSPR